jgi:hypothetical protein
MERDRAWTNHLPLRSITKPRSLSLPAFRSPEAALIVLFILSIFIVTPYLRGDGVGYYAWLRSPIFDGDLQFVNEYRHGDPSFLSNTFNTSGEIKSDLRTETHHVSNQWSVGPAVLWSPFFLLGHGFASGGQALGLDWKTDGYALPYRWFTAFGTALYGFLGLLLSYRLARQFAAVGPSLLGTGAVWAASSLPVYQYFLPFWPFTIGAFAAAGLLHMWHKPGWGVGRWLSIGVVTGLLVTIHPVALPWAVLPTLSLLGLDPGALRARLEAAAVFVSGVVIGAMPQLVGKAIVYGSPLDTGYRAEWDFLRPNIGRILFGSDHGLASWTPVTILCLCGLVYVLCRVDRRLGLALLFTFSVMVYLVGAYATYEQSSFGNRFFVLFTPGFVVGAVGLAQVTWTRWRPAIIALTAALIVWNGLLAFQWAWGMIPKRGSVQWQQVARNQLTRAPAEMMRAAVLFATDRGTLVRIVERRDLERLRAGDG